MLSRLGRVARLLSFDRAPCVDRGGLQDLRIDVLRRGVPGTGGVLMRAHDCSVDRDCPVRALTHVAVAAQLIQDLFPGSITRPAAMPVVDRLPTPVLGGQIPPRQPAAGPPEHPVENLPMVSPLPATARRAVRQQRLQPSPLLIGQIVTIKHQRGLQPPAEPIHGTRSSRPSHRGRRGDDDDRVAIGRVPYRPARWTCRGGSTG